uniref:Neuropeptide F n=5 Tax=Obtectomera TaxID=104431 RepID=A0A2A4JAB9_HELVI
MVAPATLYSTSNLVHFGALRPFEVRKVSLSTVTPLKSQEIKMLNKNIAIAVAVVLAIVCLAEAREEGPHDMADALRMLQELDRYYTQAARPRFGKRSDAYTNWAKDLEKPDLPAWLSYARRR